MSRYLLTAAFLFSAVPATAQPPAQPAPPSEPACLRQVNMYDFKPVPGNRSLIVIDRGGKRYRVNFIGQCYDLQYPMGLRFKTNGTSNLSCVSKGDSVLFRDPASPGICIVRDVQYQTPQLDQQDAAAAASAKQQ
ncbi:MAG TPA: DUF6491 family protein [Rhizomicrobium sp.]|jgi:hypothetical protein